MDEPTVKFPVICPLCGTEQLDEHPVADLQIPGRGKQSVWATESGTFIERARSTRANGRHTRRLSRRLRRSSSSFSGSAQLHRSVNAPLV